MPTFRTKPGNGVCKMNDVFGRVVPQLVAVVVVFAAAAAAGVDDVR